MPILSNPRHEKFAQELATGKSATEAYINAGFRASRQNAGRLKTKDDIVTRVAELQGNAARSTEVSIQSLIRELDDAINVAKEKGQAQAMVSAAGLKAKLTGLMVDKQEVRLTNVGSANQSVEDVADAFIAERILYFNAVDYRDREAFLAMMSRWGAELKEFEAAIEARPHTVTRVDQRDLSTPWERLNLQLKLAGPRKSG